MAKPGAVAEEAVEEEVLDGAENAEVAPDETEDVDGEGNPDPNKKGEGEEGGDPDGEASEEVPEPEVDLVAENKSLKERLEALEKGKQEPPAQKEFTPEQWKDFEDRTGVSKQQALFTTSMVASLENRIMQRMEERFGNLNQDEHVLEMAKDPKFKDAQNFKGDIISYLKDYSPEQRKNPQVRERAYFYAKGKAASNTIKRAASSKETNKRVIGKSPAKPGVSVKAKASAGSSKLTAEEIRAAKNAGMSIDDYIKSKNSSIDDLLA